MLALVMVIVPVPSTLIGLLSGLLISMNGVLGIIVRKWMFIMHGLPASIIRGRAVETARRPSIKRTS